MNSRHTAAASLHLNDAHEEEASTERVLRMARVPSVAPEIRMPTGHTVRADEAEPDRLVVCAPDGTVELAVRLTSEGPVLSFSGAALELKAARQLSIDCERLNLRAREHLELRSDGDLEQVAGRDALVQAQRRLSIQAGEVNVMAHDGSVAIDASDDVDVHGAKILLNC